MAKKKQTYEKKAFESTGVSSDTSANIYMSMFMSQAWGELTAQQRVLYLYCKAQYYAEKSKPNNDSSCFTMNQSKWNGLYSLYTIHNSRAFYRDMTKLIDFGFVECVECGAITRTKSVYKLSSMWRKYGTDSFEVSPSQKTLGMRRKENISATDLSQ